MAETDVTIMSRCIGMSIFPVEGLGKIYIKEDNDIEIDGITHKERAAHIDNVLAESGLKLYRRHIASKL